MNLSHLNQNYNKQLKFLFFSQKKSLIFPCFFLFFLFASLAPPLVIGHNKNTLGRTENLTQGTIMITRSSEKFLNFFREKRGEGSGMDARWIGSSRRRKPRRRVRMKENLEGEGEGEREQ